MRLVQLYLRAYTTRISSTFLFQNFHFHFHFSCPGVSKPNQTNYKLHVWCYFFHLRRVLNESESDFKFVQSWLGICCLLSCFCSVLLFVLLTLSLLAASAFGVSCHWVAQVRIQRGLAHSVAAMGGVASSWCKNKLKGTIQGTCLWRASAFGVSCHWLARVRIQRGLAQSAAAMGGVASSWCKNKLKGTSKEHDCDAERLQIQSRCKGYWSYKKAVSKWSRHNIQNKSSFENHQKFIKYREEHGLGIPRRRPKIGTCS